MGEAIRLWLILALAAPLEALQADKVEIRQLMREHDALSARFALRGGPR